MDISNFFHSKNGFNELKLRRIKHETSLTSWRIQITVKKVDYRNDKIEYVDYKDTEA